MDFEKYKTKLSNGLSNADPLRLDVLKKTIVSMQTNKHPDVCWEEHGRQIDIRVRELEELQDREELAMQAYREDTARLENMFKKDALDNVGMTGSVGELLFYKAWDKGRSSGYYSVWSELVELVSFIDGIDHARKEDAK